MKDKRITLTNLHDIHNCLTLLFMFIKSLCEYEPHEVLNNLNILFTVPSFTFHIFHTFITMKVKGQDPIYLFAVY